MESFKHWLNLSEMSARQSFSRTMGKFEQEKADRLYAIMTAWRGELKDSAGNPVPEPVRIKMNDEANRKLMQQLSDRGLSFYPVIGAGQEEKGGKVSMAKERSFVISPRHKEMKETEFLNHIRELLYNPTGEGGPGPFPHTQYGATVKLPSKDKAMILHYPDGTTPASPRDYINMDPIGSSAVVRREEPFYTQMAQGPRMMPQPPDPLDRPEDIGGLPPGRRFTVTDKPMPPKKDQP
jgi:hypothetical protein